MSWIERAKVGDKVVCVKRGLWVTAFGPSLHSVDPKFGDVCTIREILPLEGGRIYFVLCGYHPRVRFLAHNFKPVRDTTLQVEAIKRAALNIPEHV